MKSKINNLAVSFIGCLAFCGRDSSPDFYELLLHFELHFRIAWLAKCQQWRYQREKSRQISFPQQIFGYQTAWNEGATQSTLNPVWQERVQLPIWVFALPKIVDQFLLSARNVQKKTNTHIACEISGKGAINKCKAL